MKTRLGISAGLLAVQFTFAAVQSPMDWHLFFDGANRFPTGWVGSVVPAGCQPALRSDS